MQTRRIAGSLYLGRLELTGAAVYFKKIEPLVAPGMALLGQTNEAEEKGEAAEVRRQLKECQARHAKNLSASSAGKLAFAAVRAERAGAIKLMQRAKIIAKLMAKPGFKKAALEGAYKASAGGSKLQADYYFQLCELEYEGSHSATSAKRLLEAALWAQSKGAITAKKCSEIMEKLSGIAELNLSHGLKSEANPDKAGVATLSPRLRSGCCGALGFQRSFDCPKAQGVALVLRQRDGSDRSPTAVGG